MNVIPFPPQPRQIDLTEVIQEMLNQDRLDQARMCADKARANLAKHGIQPYDNNF